MRASRRLPLPRVTGKPAFADDSGLVVDALGGEPGIHSARWAGPDKDFRFAMNKIQTLLIERGAKTPEQRRAHFMAALCLAWPDGHVEEFDGRVDGVAVWPPRGDRGFGYDPLFMPNGHERTFGQMSANEKHGLAAERRRPVASRARFHEACGCVSALRPFEFIKIVISFPQRTRIGARCQGRRGL